MNRLNQKSSPNTRAKFSAFPSAITPTLTPSSPNKREPLRSNKSVTKLNVPSSKWHTDWDTITRNSETKITLSRSSPSARRKRRWPPSTKMTRDPFTFSSRAPQISSFLTAQSLSTEMVVKPKSLLNSVIASKTLL